MLATIRRLVACLVLLTFAASFIPWGGAEPCAALWWVERVQFVPALLGAWSGGMGAALILAALVFLTLLFGRVFCSWLCPLGMLQDAANRLARPMPARRKGKSIRYAPNHPWLRGVVAVAAFSSLAAGSVGALTWLDPYSIAARGMAAIGNPALSWLASAMGAELPLPDWARYAELPPPVWEKTAPVVMALIAFCLAVPLSMAVWRGRLYCNTLCPVGAVLGLLARFAPCAPHIENTACARCGACMKQCKAQAIDVKNMRVDTTRCVACYNCLSACQNSAMRLTPARRAPRAETPVPETEPANPSRRALLGMGLAGLASAALPELPTPAPGTNPAEEGTNTSISAVPPGAQSVERLLSHCTACGLCISNCPTQVLRPAFLTLGLRGFMMPTLDFSRSFCDPSCVTCSHACPAGALLPLELAEKRRTQIGLVRYTQAYCRVWKDGVACAKCVTEITCPTGALAAQEVTIPRVNAETCRGCRRCARVCPAGAISMVPHPGKEKAVAVIDHSKCIGCGACASACRPQAISLTPFTVPHLAHPEKCIGCGSCEHVCPARRERATPLTVIPRARHLTTPGE